LKRLPQKKNNKKKMSGDMQTMQTISLSEKYRYRIDFKKLTLNHHYQPKEWQRLRAGTPAPSLMHGFHHSVAVLPWPFRRCRSQLPWRRNCVHFWSLHPYVYGKTFPAFPFSPATATVATEGRTATVQRHGTTAQRNGNGMLETVETRH